MVVQWSFGLLDLLLAVSGCSGSAVRSFESLGCSVVTPVRLLGLLLL